ncbi:MULTISPECIES: hypothetical protein [Mycolicibacterium]|uniref:Zinc-finger NAD-dependent DNA ligase C4-type domain-containing protein n=1 Tax=[Mycobacterium] manitobense TaxID=190147 RepID=A0A9X2YPI5_9MYCO|nr:hypothetical protein [[Mycobacterium] manitobense]MCV7171519.1 hypothetical protein [[Mycobacterium] manitobense]
MVGVTGGTCPRCGAALVEIESRAAWRCPPREGADHFYMRWDGGGESYAVIDPDNVYKPF